MNAFGKVTKFVVAAFAVTACMTSYAVANEGEDSIEEVGSNSVPSTTPVAEGVTTESNLKGSIAADTSKEEERKPEVKASTENIDWRVNNRVVSYLGACKLSEKFQSVYDDLHKNGGITVPSDILNKIKRSPSGPLSIDILWSLSNKIAKQLSSKYGVKANDMKSYVFNALTSPCILEV
ncbi:uncharacterized protein BBOV_IV001040 [Babesia bovis T2Bo]|uniref:Uncharacterized protein n=1 Tax=Babesia bovis TaxID=5865 RepID=A7AV75_BABBO|nr:uncharacterized protein BBOV_IV001040 [Babesia bovis T2Bo]EDO05701.1 hypothetical protein BBOV_IV001040 [Babesia bovis T2Bo]|eukprot:XP_001609269.1 hypothetical protein [Babesia bovis T2Bo]